MAHEQSETIERDGRYYNVYGGGIKGKAGTGLPGEPATGYSTLQDAVAAAKARSTGIPWVDALAGALPTKDTIRAYDPIGRGDYGLDRPGVHTPIRDPIALLGRMIEGLGASAPGVTPAILSGNQKLLNLLQAGNPALAAKLRRIPAVVNIETGRAIPDGFRLAQGEAAAGVRNLPGIPAARTALGRDVHITVNPWSSYGRFMNATSPYANNPRLLTHEGIHAAYYQKNPLGLPPEQHTAKLFDHFSKKYPDLAKFAAEYKRRQVPYGELEAVVEGMAREAAKRAR